VSESDPYESSEGTVATPMAEKPQTTVPLLGIGSGDHWTAFYSHYDPDKGGINCSEPCSVTSSGNLVAEWWNRGAACPNEFPFGTVITLPGGEELICIDRFSQTYKSELANHPSYGHYVSRIIPGTSSFWVDVLSKDAPVPYGTQMTVHVQFP
jgi:hypothetical protein